MNLAHTHLSWAVMLVLAGLLALPAGAYSQQANPPEKVRFTTVDGVELHGSFYASANAPAPTVMLLHAIGEDSKKKGWTGLAEELQKSGLSVLTFDFRGHGASTDVTPDQFGKFAYNRQYVKGYAKGTIDYKNFDKTYYYPVLVNDIAAAKAYLDRNKNDQGVCNTSSLILIGGETGATLGALWLNAEWHRFRMIPQQMFMPAKPDTRTEGKDTICAIWLSISPKLGGRTIKPASLLDLPGKTGATPMVFMFSDGDSQGKGIARNCERDLKVAKDEKYKYTAAVEIKGNANLKGVNLLQKSLGTEKAIVGYLEDVLQSKGNEWVDREFRKAHYVWRMGFNQFQPAKFPNETNFQFDTYEKFLR